ncbi:MAG TPA: alcohol dehydrogenase catalytic domain-containing protein [Actinomycetota bacterium]|nr:alcohol dehydrogenase catalytic domain-containing protein [Actinomycetota bacterium]
MPGEMRAAVFEGYRTINVRSTAIPEPRPGEVRIKVIYCGICGSDVSLFKTGMLGGPDQILGHEIVGVVEFDPSNRWPVGARVVAYPVRGCGKCLWCEDGEPRYCLEPPGSWGGLAEYVCYPSKHLIAVPDHLDDQAAALAEPFGVALRAVELAAAKRGELALVLGLGSLGCLSAVGLAAAGCRVIGTDIRDDRRVLGLEVGCSEVFDPEAEDPFWKMLSYDPHGPRIAFECSGAPQALQQAFNACGHGGVVGVLGIPFDPAVIIPAVFSVKEQRAFSISGPSIDSMQRALELLAERPQTAKIITGTVTLDEAQSAFAGLAEGTGGVKVLVSPER